MMLFLLGLGVVQSGVLLVAVAASRGADGADVVGLALSLVIAPFMMAMSAALLVQAFTPRRLFDRRLRRPLKRFALGACASLAGTIPAALALVFVPEGVHDVAVTGGCAALGAAAMLLPLSRRQAGQCVYCDYDLRATPADRPCPECGRPDGR